MKSFKNTGLALLIAAGVARPAAAEVTLINVFEVPAGQMETVITAWEAARDFLSQEPGYIETALHQSLRSEARFQLINIATWESPEAFADAVSKMQAAGVYQTIPGLGVNPALYTVVRSDGGEAG